MEDDKLISIPRKRLTESVEQIMDLTARRIADVQDLDGLNEVRGGLNVAADLSAQMIYLIDYGDDADMAVAAEKMKWLNARTVALKDSCHEIETMMSTPRPTKNKKAGSWTKVQENPPYLRTSVLVHHKYGTIRIGQMTLNRSGELMWYDGFRYWKVNPENDWWHPLPELPEEGGGE